MRIRWVVRNKRAAAAAFPVILALINPHPIYIPFAVVIGAFIFYRHRENLDRLWAGRENKFGAKKSPAP